MFKNREEAGKRLSEQLKIYKGRKDLLVLAIPRGGVVVGETVAEKLSSSLDVLVVKKLGAPNNPELAIGAMGPAAGKLKSVIIIHQTLANQVGADENYLKQEIERIAVEIKRREKEFRGGRKALTVKNKTVILIDDGIATGATIEAGIAWLKEKKAKKIILAVPVAAPDTIEKLKESVNELIALEVPDDFAGVGQFYEDFPQVSDEEVKKILSGIIGP